jgi:hypothetical protein
MYLRGPALLWWDHFKMMQPNGHEITWAEFKTAFKNHHIPKGMVERKLNELLNLRQGSDSVYQYAQKFNNMCQYGDYYVDTDAKKMDRFRRGLDPELYEKLYEQLSRDSGPGHIPGGCNEEGAECKEKEGRVQL